MPLFNAKSLNTQNDILMQNLLEFYKNNENMERFLDIVHGPRLDGSDGEESANTISLRIIDWFVTNYAKKYYTTYDIVPLSHGVDIAARPSEVPPSATHLTGNMETDRTRFVSNCVTEHTRFKVYNDYKLKLKAYSKRRFDPFCRWERIQVPFTSERDDTPKHMETTIGQLNFFKWAIENHILDYIQAHYHDIERDMNTRNTTSKHRNLTETSTESVDSYASNSSNSYDSGKTGAEMTNTCSKTRKKREELSISACKCIRKETVKILVKFS